MKHITAVVFDMDGVIVHSNPTHKETIHEFCKKYALEVTEKYLREHVYGRTNKDWIPQVFGDLPEHEIEKLGHEKEQMFREVFDPVANMVPGITDFLEKLDRLGIKKVVATSAPVENADYILSTLSIKHLFEAVLSSADVKNSKPHPEPYLKAAKAAGVNPEQCVVFEDSISGVESGLAAGAKVVGVATTHSHEELSACDLVIDDFTGLEFLDLLEKVAQKKTG